MDLLVTTFFWSSTIHTREITESSLQYPPQLKITCYVYEYLAKYCIAYMIDLAILKCLLRIT